MTFTPYETIKRLLPEIEEWEERTDWAETDEQVAEVIEENANELIQRYGIDDLIVILQSAFDRIVNVTDGHNLISMDTLNGNEHIFAIYCEDDVAYIEI